MVIEALWAVSVLAAFVGGWCCKRHSCRELAKRTQPPVIEAELVDDDIPQLRA